MLFSLRTRSSVLVECFAKRRPLASRRIARTARRTTRVGAVRSAADVIGGVTVFGCEVLGVAELVGVVGVSVVPAPGPVPVPDPGVGAGSVTVTSTVSVPVVPAASVTVTRAV